MRRWGEGPTGLTEKVRRDRIRIAVAAWAYEKGYRPTMSDRDYDQLSQEVYFKINVATGDYRLDRFFQRHFNPNTSLWVHAHPHLRQLESIYARCYQRKKRRKRRRR